MDTQQKYDEAKYFLEMMRENIEDRQKFEYNLSAFLAAARSVTLFLKKRFLTKSDYNDWYFANEQKDKTGILKFFREKRNIVIHEKLINPRSEISTTINIAMAVSASFEAIVRNAEGTIKDYEYSKSPAKPKPASKPNSREETKYKWFFKDWQETDEDVTTLCEKYLNKLKIIIEEVESKFGETNVPQKPLTDK